MAKLQLPDQEASYWVSSVAEPKYPKLQEDMTIDVAVVGAGIAGLSAAYFLKQAGLKVAVLERNTVGAGVTGHTTGKVTSQHSLCYAKLQKNFGQETARLYGEANQAAIEQMEAIIAKENIACEWRRRPHYVFTEKSDEVVRLKHEADIAKKLGLPAVFCTTTPLPFAVKGAVRFSDQATFNARSYALGLARAIQGGGSFIFEHTAAKSVRDGVPCTLTTPLATVTAKDVVVATNVPFPLLTHTYFGAYEYPLKSYIVAARIAHDLDGMYITPGGPIRSILPVISGKERLLLIGGESHFPGFGNARERHQRLAEYAQERFNISSIRYRWSAWDYLSNDGVPLIGKQYPWSRHAYVATGFMKWGLTTGTVAGMILRDAIMGQPNPWAKVYRTNRLSPIASLPKAMASIFRSLL